eukprot:scaffold33057_cov38-Prasinocladus_malaysianus.AAC.3
MCEKATNALLKCPRLALDISAMPLRLYAVLRKQYRRFVLRSRPVQDCGSITLAAHRKRMSRLQQLLPPGGFWIAHTALSLN